MHAMLRSGQLFDRTAGMAASAAPGEGVRLRTLTGRPCRDVGRIIPLDGVPRWAQRSASSTLGRSYPREDPSCSGPVLTAKTTLNPAHVRPRPERRALHNEPRLDDTITPRHHGGAHQTSPRAGPVR